MKKGMGKAKVGLGYPDNVVVNVNEFYKDSQVTATAYEYHTIQPEEIHNLTREQFHALVKKSAQPVKKTTESDSASGET